MNIQSDLLTMLARAKIGIMQRPDTMFFSTLCSNLETHFTTQIPTACTNGVELLINPDFFGSLTLEERVFLLAHETLHVAYLHVLRKGDRDPRIFNMAADYVINLELVDRGFPIIKGGLINKGFRGMSTEEIYKYLIENPPPEDQHVMEDLQSEAGEGRKQDQQQKANAEAVEAEVLEKIKRAIMVAEMSNQVSSVPKDIQRHFEELRKPKVNWKQVLYRFIHALTQDDYSWRRPNKRYFPHYLPKLNNRTLSRLDFAIDTSGSITQDQFTQFISELSAIIRMMQPKELGVYQFDHHLQGSDVVKNIRDLLTIQFKGGGGTYPQSALGEFEANQALGLIVLTDGYFYQHDLRDPKRPVIWVVYNNPNFVSKFGQVTHITL